MFDKEKMFQEKTAIRVNKKEYDELKEWGVENLSGVNNMPTYYSSYSRYCLRFEYWNGNERYNFSNQSYYEQCGYNILTLDDIRIKEIDFDKRCLSSDYAIHCDTEEKANNLLKWFHCKGVEWVSHKNLSHHSYYNRFGDNTVYSKNKLFYNQIGDDQFKDKTILKYDDVVINNKKKLYTIEEIKEQEIAVHCPEKYQTDELINFIRNNKKDIHIYLKDREYRKYEKETCHLISDADVFQYGSLTWQKGHDTKIINFDEVNFNDIKEENNKMKYKLVKELTGKSIVETACENEFNKFVKRYGYTNPVIWHEENEKHAFEQNRWISFLEDKGYLEEIVSKIIYDATCYYVVRQENDIFKLSEFNSSLEHDAYNTESRFAFISITDNDYFTETFKDPQDTIDNMAKNHTIITLDGKDALIDYIKRNV